MEEEPLTQSTGNLKKIVRKEYINKHIQSTSKANQDLKRKQKKKKKEPDIYTFIHPSLMNLIHKYMSYTIQIVVT